jgi:hypothetical protein
MPPPEPSTKFVGVRLCYLRFLADFFEFFFAFALVFDAFFGISASPFRGTGLLDRPFRSLPLSIYH